MMVDKYILHPKAIYGSICKRGIKNSFIGGHEKSTVISGYHWDSRTKVFAYRVSNSYISNRPQPLNNKRFVVVFEGRIDEIKGVQVFSNQQNISEKELLLYYLKFGKELPNRMYGDWSFAIYDRKLDELFISRDHNGNSVVHYTMNRNAFHFATLLEDLLKNISFPPVLDEKRIVDINGSRDWKSEGTYYKNIFRLPPGTSLIYYKDDIKLIQYWFPEDLPKIVYRNDEDYYDHFKELFHNAVKSRIRLSLSPAVALSGGLDSGAVASVASTILEESNRKIQTYTSIPAFDVQNQYLSRITNEWPIVQSLIKRYNNIDAVKFNSLNYSPIQTAERTIKIFREPVWAVANYNWLFDLFERTKNNNDTLLFGAMGNMTISWPFPEFKYACPDLIISDIKKIYSLAFRRKVFLERVAKKSLLSTSFIRRNVSINSLIRNQYPFGIFDFHSILHKTINLRKNYIGAEMKTSSIKFDTNILDPTNDRYVMEFVLNIPPRIFSNNNGSRLLVRKGLKEYLPQEYLINKRRGIQSSDIVQRMEYYNIDLLVELNRIKSKSFLSKYFNLDKIDQLIIKVKSRDLSGVPFNNIMRYLALIYFLEEIE